MKLITVLGGSGFVGRSLVARLDQSGFRVRVLTRRRERAKHLILLPNVSVVECNVLDEAALQQALTGSDAVINLIGILHQSKKDSFDQLHHQLPAMLGRLCQQLGIRRLLHMSALQAAPQAPSAYLRSKAAGEQALLAMQPDLQVTILRPSVIFGSHDQFINLFAKLVKVVPVLVLAMPEAKFQPVWVEDVSSAFVNAIEQTATHGKVYELGGPHILSLRQILQLVMQTVGVQRPIVGLNSSLSLLQGSLMEWLPVKLMSRDNVLSMQVDNVCHQPLANELCILPSDMAAIVPTYLAEQSPRGCYPRFRAAAGRAINARR